MADPLQHPHDFHPGQDVTWLYKAPSGHVFSIAAQVVRVTGRRVLILAPLAGGKTDEHSVKPEALRPRDPGEHHKPQGPETPR